MAQSLQRNYVFCARPLFRKRLRPASKGSGTRWEHHVSVSARARSLMWKLALVQFINTGVLLTAVNAQLYDLAAALPGTLGTGAFDDFVPQWYQIVGVGISVQVVSTGLLSSGMPLVMAQVRTFIIL